jgi:excisionase family DNA binding protein
MTSTTDLLSVAEVAHELGLTTRAVQHRITNGALAAHRVGSVYVITRDELDRALSEKTA